MFRDRGMRFAGPTTLHKTLYGQSAETGEFFTYYSGDVRDDVTGRPIEAQYFEWNYGRMVDKRLSAGGAEKYPQDLAYAFIGLATYDTALFGVQQRPAGADPS